MLHCNGKHCNDSKVAKSRAAAREDMLNVAAMDTEITKRNCLPLEGFRRQGSPATCLCFHCPPLNEVWEGMDPGCTSSGHSGVLYAPELLELALPSYQVLNHCFRPWLSNSTTPTLQDELNNYPFFDYEVSSLRLPILHTTWLTPVQVCIKFNTITVLFCTTELIHLLQQRKA